MFVLCLMWDVNVSGLVQGVDNVFMGDFHMTRIN